MYIYTFIPINIQLDTGTYLIYYTTINRSKIFFRFSNIRVFQLIATLISCKTCNSVFLTNNIFPKKTANFQGMFTLFVSDTITKLTKQRRGVRIENRIKKSNYIRQKNIISWCLRSLKNRKSHEKFETWKIHRIVMENVLFNFSYQ